MYSWEEYLSSPPRRLTTTSYALLGLIALRPWSTYELAGQMRRNLHYLWPRAESNLYAEAKRLVEGGFAHADSQPVGRRRRTVYSITPAGRGALRHWVGEPAAPTRLESEPLVKLMFADHGSKDDLLDTLRRFREDARTRQQELLSIFREYVRDEDPFPERVHINVMAYRLLWDYAQAEITWSDRALAEAEQWTDVGTPASRRDSIAVLASLLHSAESDEAIMLP